MSRTKYSLAIFRATVASSMGISQDGPDLNQIAWRSETYKTDSTIAPPRTSDIL